MSTLLRIDASSRVSGSRSRDLGDHLEARWRQRHPDGIVRLRDVTAEPLGHIAPATIAGFYTPTDQMTADLRSATELSDRLIAELQSADALLITTPMYNFTVPSALKAWIDQIVRIGHTFAYDGASFSGLARTDVAYVLCAYGAGGYTGGGPLASADFVTPYLGFLFQFLGISRVSFIGIEGTTGDADRVEAGMSRARGEIDGLFFGLGESDSDG